MQTILLGIGALGLNLPALVAQLVSFTLLLVVFRAFLYKPVIRMLDERKKRTEQEVAKELEKARQQGQEQIAQAQQIAARIQEDARQGAREEAEQLLARARSEFELEKNNAIAALRREFASLTIGAAERVIKEELNPEKHRRLIEEVLAEAPSTGTDGADRG